MASPHEISPLLPSSVSNTARVTKSLIKGPLSTRQTRMMEVANLYIHQTDSELQRRFYIENLERLRNDFRLLLSQYEAAKRDRLSGMKRGCGNEAWEALTKKVNGKGPLLQKVLDSKLYKLSLKQVLDLVSFINAVEMLLPPGRSDPADESNGVDSAVLNSTNTQSLSLGPSTLNVDGAADTPTTSEVCCFPVLRPRGRNISANEGNHGGLEPITMIDNTSAPTPPGGTMHLLPTTGALPKPTSRDYSKDYWYFNGPAPNSRVPQALPFDRLSTLVASSLSGEQCTPGCSCSIGPPKPLIRDSPLAIPPITVSLSGGQCTPGERCSTGLLQSDAIENSTRLSAPTDTLSDGSGIQCALGESCSVNPIHAPQPRNLPLSKAGKLQRPKNPLGRILEEEHELSENIRTRRPFPLEVSCGDGSLVHSRSHILGSLLMNANPRPKPTPTDSLLYWLLQDHTEGEEIPTFSRTEEGKNLFRLMMCLWAEPVVGSGPFDREWKRLVREREMKRWSEVGGETEVNVISVLIMMSLLGAEVGLGLFRGAQKTQHKCLSLLSNPVSEAALFREETSPWKKEKSKTHDIIPVRDTAVQVSKTLEAANIKICPVCKRKGNASVACPCARTLLQGMGVIAPSIPPPPSRAGRSIGRRSRRHTGGSAEVSSIPKTHSLPPALTPHDHVQRRITHSLPDGLPFEVHSTSNSISSVKTPLESVGSALSRINKWHVDDSGRLVKEATPEEHRSPAGMDISNISSPFPVMGSQTKHSSPHEPLLSTTTRTSTEAYHQPRVVKTGREVDVSFTLYGAAQKLQLGNATSPETPLTILSEDRAASAEGQTPLTNKEVNIYSEDDRSDKGKVSICDVHSSMLFPLQEGISVGGDGEQELQDEDTPPEWIKHTENDWSVRR